MAKADLQCQAGRESKDIDGEEDKEDREGISRFRVLKIACY